MTRSRWDRLHYCAIQKMAVAAMACLFLAMGYGVARWDGWGSNRLTFEECCDAIRNDVNTEVAAMVLADYAILAVEHLKPLSDREGRDGDVARTGLTSIAKRIRE